MAMKLNDKTIVILDAANDLETGVCVTVGAMKLAGVPDELILKTLDEVRRQLARRERSE